MIRKNIKVKDIVSYLGDEVLNVIGDYTIKEIDNIADIERVTESTLDWVNPSRNDRQQLAENSKAKVLLVDPTIVMTEGMKESGKVLISVENPKMTLMKVSRQFFVVKPTPGIDPTAVIHPNARLGKNNFIGPHCYIGDCEIGDNNIIHANVTIYDRTIIGSNNEISQLM